MPNARTRPAQASVLPGFGLTMGFTLFYLSLIVLIPLSTILLKTFSMSWDEFWKIMLSQRTISAFKISFATSFYAAVVDLVFGSIVGWVLVRYRFPAKELMDALVDLPFALPTAVAGIVLTTLFSPLGWIGKFLVPNGINVNYTQLGITIALTFVGLPFVVRTIQPVLAEFDKSTEEMAASMGANRFRFFRRDNFSRNLAGYAYWFYSRICQSSWRVWLDCFYFGKYSNEN